jgi:hypothetical protein
MFFPGGIVSDEELAARLLDCAVALGAQSAKHISLQTWQVVGSATNWFASARFQVPESLNPPWPAPVPEWAENSVRPEMLISLLARDIFMKTGTTVSRLKGSTPLAKEPFSLLSEARTWTRIIAFRGATIEA